MAWAPAALVHLPSSPLTDSPRLAQTQLLRRHPFTDFGTRLTERTVSAFLLEEAHGRLFLLIPVFLGLGVVFWFSMARDPPAWLGMVGLPLLLAGLTLYRRGRSLAGLLLMAAGLVFAGMGLAAIETLRHATVVLDTPVTTRLTGVVERREAAGEGRWRYEIRLTGTRTPVLIRQPEKVAVLARGRGAPVEPGQTISGLARLSPPSGPALPGLSDFGFSAYFDGIGAIGYFYGAPSAGVAPDEAIGAWQRLRIELFALRGAIGDRIRSIVPGDAGAFAAAIVTDERRAISRDTLEALRLSGLAHIVAISGLNMALAAGIFFVGVRTLLSLMPVFAQSSATKKIAAAGALLMVTAYYLISGFGVSAERAFLMMAIMLVAVFFDRPSISLHNVALAALVILVVSPSALLGASFQMSFAATAALVAGYAAWMSHRNRSEDHAPRATGGPFSALMSLCLAMVAGTAMTSLIGGLSTAMFSASHFHQLTGYGLVANLAAMPLISLVVMPCGLAGMLLMPFGLDAPFFQLMGQALDLVISVARTVAGWGGEMPTGRPHPWFLGLAVSGFLILVIFKTRIRLLGLPLMAAAIGMFVWSAQRPMPSLLIFEDGTLAALLDDRTASINRRKPPDFIYRQWLNALRIENTVQPLQRQPDEIGLSSPDQSNSPAAESSPPPTAASSANDTPNLQRMPLPPEALKTAAKAFQTLIDTSPAGRFACVTKIACLAKTQEGIKIAMIEDGRYAGIGCDVADIVIATSARFETCRSGALLLSGKVLRLTGTLEIDFNGSRAKNDWQASGAVHGAARPWTIARAYDWRNRTFDADLPEPVRLLLAAPAT